MIHTLTKAHTNADTSKDSSILDRLEVLTYIMIITGCIFFGLAVVSGILKLKYRGVQGKSPEDIEDDIQKMLREKNRLLEN